jgi:hypothetical protein
MYLRQIILYMRGWLWWIGWWMWVEFTCIAMAPCLLGLSGTTFSCVGCCSLQQKERWLDGENARSKALSSDHPPIGTGPFGDRFMSYLWSSRAPSGGDRDGAGPLILIAIDLGCCGCSLTDIKLPSYPLVYNIWTFVANTLLLCTWNLKWNVAIY